ncbi:MAG TPA: prepilin-type N-terminal cleavage/methylation domain-containing protein [Phycisphaerales bacterium]|nr:prepilin-type N-terminal cleavage/methylation domain-containing protein [Phycisphaerales bacterium]
MRSTVRKGFTLVEILIVVVILGILAAIVVPQFTNASTDAQIGNVRTQLQTIRSQIELYRVRNNGSLPPLLVAGGAEDAAWDDLVGSDYMRAFPINPRVGNGNVALSADSPPVPAAGDADGWLFNATTGEIAAGRFDEAAGTWLD